MIVRRVKTVGLREQDSSPEMYMDRKKQEKKERFRGFSNSA